MAKLNELITEIKSNLVQENTDTKFNYDLYKMENKLKYDTIMFELLSLGIDKDIIEEPPKELNEAISELFKITAQLYETLDLKPIALGINKINSTYSLHETANQLANILNEQLGIIYEACKRNKKLKEKKSKMLDEATQFMMKLLNENEQLTETEIKAVEDYIESKIVLSELFDAILFPMINNKIIKNVDTYLSENEFIDEQQVYNLIEQYEEAKQKVIDVLLNEGQVITSYVLTAAGAITLPTIIIPVINYISRMHQLSNVSKCAENDYLSVKLVFKDNEKDTPNILERIAAFRKYALYKLVSNEQAVLIFRSGVARLLKSNFPKIEFNKILLDGGKLEYTPQEFKQTYEKHFKLFGEFRRIYSPESALLLFSNQDLNKCEKINLVWLGMLMRQLIKYAEDLNAEKIILEAPKYEKVELPKSVI